MAVEEQGPFKFNQAVDKARELAKKEEVPPQIAFEDESWPGKKGSLSWDPKGNNGKGAILLHPYDQKNVRESSGNVLSVTSSGSGKKIDTRPETGSNN